MKRLLRLARALRETSWKPLLLLTAACLLLREQYPLSNFPMYSSFSSKTFYVYLADGDGAPLAAVNTFGVTTPTLKKIFVNETRRERERSPEKSQRLTNEQKQIVGARLLSRLKNSPAARERGVVLPPVLRLYEVDISMAGGRFERQTALIAEVR